MRIGLVTIGDELLAGKILNTNAFDLAVWLSEMGHSLAFAHTVADTVDLIVQVLHSATDANHPSPFQCDILLLTGGLGPTTDDVTRQSMAQFLASPLSYSMLATQWLAQRLGVQPHAISAGQKTQLEIPESSQPLHNPAGTACGFCCEKNSVKIFAFPGVPSEFRAMFDAHCRPLLQRRDAVLLRRQAITFGLSESRQREFLHGFILPSPFRFSSLPSDSGVTLSLEAFVSNSQVNMLTLQLERSWNELLARLPVESVVSPNGASLTETVFYLLNTRHATISVAESCTSGALGYLLTEISGSSAFFKQGFLTYTNQAKTQLLQVSPEMLQSHGAVSENVAIAMAIGCREVSKTDYAVSITGIAGPEGGSEEKPVGLVYIGVSSKKDALAKSFSFRGNRKSVRWQSAYAALNMLRLFIINDL